MKWLFCHEKIWTFLGSCKFRVFAEVDPAFSQFCKTEKFRKIDQSTTLSLFSKEAVFVTALFFSRLTEPSHFEI